MAYDALRTILPIDGWPEERAREVQISVSDTLGPRFAHDSSLEGGGFEPSVPRQRVTVVDAARGADCRVRH
jgi:hypothetical protein